MELKWLEDFLILRDHGSFSKAAVQRNVTQPAFSRRIRALEDWLDVELVDRTRKPLRFTNAAEVGEADMRHIVSRFYELRSGLRAESMARHRIVFTAQHTLTAHYLPQLLGVVDRKLPHIQYRIRSANKPDCIAQLARGEADFLLCYEKGALEAVPPALNTRRIVLGNDRLVPVSGCNEPGVPLHHPQPDEPLPIIDYPEKSFFGQVVRDTCLPALLRSHDVQTVCVSAFSVAVKELALHGLGVAWLPLSLIRDDLSSGRLASLEPLFGHSGIDIVLHAMTTVSKSEVDAIWQAIDAKEAV